MRCTSAGLACGRAAVDAVPATAAAKAPRMKSRKQVEARLATPNLPVDYSNALKWTLGWSTFEK